MDKTLPPGRTLPTEIYEDIVKWVDLTQLWSISNKNEAPNEVRKLSIEAHRDRLSTLCSCALTSRPWFPTSRAALYRNLIFPSTDRIPFEHLVRSLDSNLWLGTRIETIAVIDNHEPSGASPRTPTSECVGDISQTWPTILAGKISKLPRLHMLHVTLVDGLTRHLRYIRSMQTFSTITTLSLAWSLSGSFSDLFRLIATFPNLRTLSLDATSWIPRGPPTVVPPRRFPALTQLTVVSHPSNLEHDVWGKLSQILLHVVASTIRILDIPVVCIPYDLSDPITMPCLQTLRVRDELYPDTAWHNGVDWILRSAPLLKNLVVDLPPLEEPSVPHKVHDFWGLHDTPERPWDWRLPLHHTAIISCLLTTTITSMATLLVTHDIPQSLDMHAQRAKKSTGWVRWVLQYLNVYKWDVHEDYILANVVWSGLTEDLSRVHLATAARRGKVVHVSPLELTSCPLEQIGSYGSQQEDEQDRPGRLIVIAELDLGRSKDKHPQLRPLPRPHSSSSPHSLIYHLAPVEEDSPLGDSPQQLPQLPPSSPPASLLSMDTYSDCESA